MRVRFEQQYELGVKLIQETPVLLKSRDDVPALVMALLKIYNDSHYNTQIFNILERFIMKEKKQTGRKGLTLWQIFVLAQFRLALNLDYDRLHYMVSSDTTIRQLLGIETETGFDRIEIGYQRIIDNLHLLNEEMLKEINNVIVSFGHREVFKKKEAEALQVKTDSFVVESNVHFPTDYGLLFDSIRKAVSVMKKMDNKHSDVIGWRKIDDWEKSLKYLCRGLGRAASTGGKNKENRVRKAANNYLKKAIAFRNKLETNKHTLPINDNRDLADTIALDRFIDLISKHIDLIERRLLKGESIPHEEKIFSIFEEYTEWITKGKKRPSVELGKKLSITTEQYGLIIDYKIMNHESDSQIVLSTADRVLLRYDIYSWSFDKGYYHKDNKWLLKTAIEKVVMPKKGKRTKEETEEEQSPEFKKTKHKHSAIESNINELEHNGLDRCPDKGYEGFKRYIAIGIIAHNLQRIGKELLKLERSKGRKRYYLAA